MTIPIFYPRALSEKERGSAGDVCTCDSCGGQFAVRDGQAVAARGLLTGDGDGKAAARLPNDGSDIGSAYQRLHPDSGERTMRCDHCGAPLNAAGFFQDDDAEAERGAQLEREARELMKGDPSLDLGQAMRLVNGKRDEEAQRVGDAIRSGVTPGQRERADAIHKATKRVMSETGADYSAALRRVLREHRAVAKAYERDK